MEEVKSEEIVQANSGLCNRFKWIPTSSSLLEAAEKRILQFVKSRYESRFVPIHKSNDRIWTAMFHSSYSKSRTPFVFVHGFGAGLGLWALNIDSLSKQRPLYAFDLLGFGRSTRPKFPDNPEAAEEKFIDSIEHWRHQLKLDKMILVGHSFGGYLASSYAMKYPDRIQHLVLVDPWGFPEKPANFESRVPVLLRIIAKFVMGISGTILSVVRFAGPYGPDLVKRGRPDLQGKFSELFEDDTVTNYIYHCNAQNPSGERAFKNLMMSWGFAKDPLIHRIHKLDKDVPMTFIYGADTYSIIDPTMGEKTQEIRQSSKVKVHLIEEASHHVYADQPKEFNNLLLNVCDNEP